MPPFPIISEFFTGTTNPQSPAYIGQTTMPKLVVPNTSKGTISSPMLGAGNGPGPSTGQLSDNPFNNTFNFQIPQPDMSGVGAASSGTGGVTTNGGVSSYLPLIVVGVIVAGLGWFLFERKK